MIPVAVKPRNLLALVRGFLFFVFSYSIQSYRSGHRSSLFTCWLVAASICLALLGGMCFSFNQSLIDCWVTGGVNFSPSCLWPPQILIARFNASIPLTIDIVFFCKILTIKICIQEEVKVIKNLQVRSGYSILLFSCINAAIFSECLKHIKKNLKII